MHERWAPIPGFPCHQVSDKGRVRRHVVTFNTPAQMIRPHTSLRTGYVSVHLCHDNEEKTFRLNRLVCQAFNGTAPSPDYHAAHVNGVRTDNRAENLIWVSAKENIRHKRAHGTWQAGETHGQSELDDAKVRQIRKAYFSAPRYACGKIVHGELKAIAERFDVAREHIWMVATKKAWRHVT